ncbi:MAG: hypothetical protein KJO80_15730, partial [Gammaproteobacteria bacterium]|nr:hypothetical protein [Gammaproteobacteria bacterium]
VNGGYLQASTIEEMFTNVLTSAGKSTDYGIGWHIGFELYMERYSENLDAIRIMQEHPDAVMHSGGSMGGSTMMILCRDHQRAVAVVKNVDGDESSSHFLLALRTLDIFHQHPQ